jgi:hypothetical protein
MENSSPYQLQPMPQDIAHFVHLHASMLLDTSQSSSAQDRQEKAHYRVDYVKGNILMSNLLNASGYWSIRCNITDDLH